MIRLLLTDGHPPAREALRAGLGSAGLAVVGAVPGSGDELLAQLPGTAPTAVLFDLSLPGPDAFALLAALREQCPQLRVLARGELTKGHYVARAFGLGARGPSAGWQSHAVAAGNWPVKLARAAVLPGPERVKAFFIK